MDKKKKNKGLNKILINEIEFFYFRFSENLIEAKQIGTKKGLYMGICQAFAQVAIYISFTVTFWCKYLDNLIQWLIYLNSDGPYLARHECQNYTVGTVIVVCKTIKK